MSRLVNNVKPIPVNQIEQGQNFDFDYTLTGNNLDAFTVTYAVLQYPGVAAALTGTMVFNADTKTFTATLTPAETATLAPGQWFIHILATSASENIPDLIKLYVKRNWV